jgi:hypothetical protein
MNTKPIIHFFSKPKLILGLYLLLAIIFSLLNFNKGQTKTFAGEEKYTHYNNYVIFKNAYFHLQEGKNLYIHFPEKQWDLYKYSPSFAAAMLVLACMPDWLGLLLWNLANVLVLFYGVRYFIKGPPHTLFMVWFIFNELVTSVANSQSNPMIAGLLVAAFTFFEKDKLHWAALCIISTYYIKVFGIIAALLFLFYPNKGKFVMWCIAWSVVIALIPLFFTTPDLLIWQYKNWLELLANDHSDSYGYSFMGILHTWFGLNSGKDLLVILGLICLLIPFIFSKQYTNFQYRLNWFVAMLIWLVIFNHKAESPTFIIAFAGIALWVFSSPKTNFLVFWAILAFVFTSLAPTDIFPLSLRKNFFEPYAIKAVPCVLIWLYLTFYLIKKGLKKS